VGTIHITKMDATVTYTIPPAHSSPSIKQLPHEGICTGQPGCPTPCSVSLNRKSTLEFRSSSSIMTSTGPMYLVFCRLYPSSPSQHGSVWLLPVISQLLSNIVSRCGLACLERFRGSQKKDERGPLSVLITQCLSHVRVCELGK
jgi:hypothetical protein